MLLQSYTTLGILNYVKIWSMRVSHSLKLEHKIVTNAKCSLEKLGNFLDSTEKKHYLCTLCESPMI